ncbi:MULTISPECIES: GtrA family protein [unclassified Undibacterium]|uniref:GtrA family protein n=1 Tax=unclassified Undibacterium TaxID=2630295 RepID=UPI002AC9AD72|nr:MULTISPECIES: GtrA family protein [unclassified Undibacterium]MEB0138482.1 GtrA family protein [Undibacterium sp. CCC2.1]MEB0174269.1 GtrA family protein [Undibacterium sp. CCC1.1]MEB0176169.1 GtrA family protein [Undibacterium sp. CCC3.4]MEB0215435.1 GtrA family protein [Undibacterium sp. 5I2]WPX42775.1 GtrA family protein [Undibacterium sp. CCC3.4]
MKARSHTKQFSLFLLCSGLAALLNFSARIVFNRWVDFAAAVLLAYVCGMLLAFILAKYLVFTDSRQTLSHSLLFFIVVNGLAILQTYLISVALLRWLAPAAAHAIGIAVPVLTSYLGHRYGSFRAEPLR